MKREREKKNLFCAEMIGYSKSAKLKILIIFSIMA